jgi:Restriction endonuclease S subunits
LESSAQPAINQKTIQNLIIPIPPLSEQQQIASILSNTDEKIQSYKRYKEKLQRLKTSLMQKLLTGEVRVAV